MRIKRYYSVVAHGPNTVELRHGVWNPVSFTLNDSAETGHLFPLVRRLDGSATPRQIAREEGVAVEEVEALLDHLIQLGVVERASSNCVDYYLDQAIPFFSGAAAQDVSIRPVLLLGQHDLVRALRGYLQQTLGDLDASVVERGDPAWAVLTSADRSWLADGLQFEAQVDTFARWRDHFLVYATDVINPVHLEVLNRVCLAHELPWLHVALDGPFVFVGPLFVPGRSACYGCFETRIAMNLRESASYQRYKQAIVEGQLKHGAGTPPPLLCGLAAAHASLEALSYLLTGSSCLIGRVLAMYLPTMEFAYHDVLRLPGCSACGPSPDRDGTELYFDMRAFCR